MKIDNDEAKNTNENKINMNKNNNKNSNNIKKMSNPIVMEIQMANWKIILDNQYNINCDQKKRTILTRIIRRQYKEKQQFNEEQE